MFQYTIYELLLQCCGLWTSLDQPVQLWLPCCYKWYVVLLGGLCQISMHSLHHPIMVVAALHVGLSILAVQFSHLYLVMHHLSSFLLHFLSSFCQLFHLVIMFKKYIDSHVIICCVFNFLSFFIFFIFLIFLIFLILFIIISTFCLFTISFESSLN